MSELQLLEAMLEGAKEATTVTIAARVGRALVARLKAVTADAIRWEAAFNRTHALYISERSNRERLEQELARYMDAGRPSHRN